MRTFTKAASAAVLATAMAFAAAPSASASEGGFLQGLSEDNIVITNTANALRTGYLVCAALSNGYSPTQVAGAVLHDAPSLTPHQAGYVVGLSIRELC